MKGKIANIFLATEENNYRPLLLTYKAFLIYAFLLILLRIALGSIPTAGGAGVESDTLMRLINEERSRRNLTTLTTDSRLVSAATVKSSDMIERNYFAHQDPDGNYIWNVIINMGYTPYKILGENLALDFLTAEGMIKAWLDSPTHRANLLHSDFLDQGLSAQFGDYKDRYTNLTASLFGTLLVAETPQTPPPPQSSEVKSETEQTTILPPPQNQPPILISPPSSEKNGSEEEVDINNDIQEFPIATTTAPGGPIITPHQSIDNDPMPIANIGLLMSRIVFTVFGLFLLIILTVDSVIIYKRGIVTSRAHSSYHLMGIMLLVLISILIWWW